MSGAGHLGRLSCAEVQDMAGEMGVGVLVGIERAAVLEHLEDCGSCRAVVEDMAELGDSLLLLGPEEEPPAGFESRLLQRAQEGGPAVARRRRRVAVSLAGLAVAALGATGLALGLAVSGGSGFQVVPASALHQVGGRKMAVAVLSDHGAAVGQAFLYSGSPSWLFMTVDSDVVHGPVTCEVETTSGATVVLGTFQVGGSYHAWGSTLAMAPDDIKTIRLVDATHRPVGSAAF